MEKNIEVSLLLDFYGELLKPGVRQTIDLYYNDDLSLAEVADRCGITRQGVRDSVKRGEAQLFDFEKKLGLMRRFRELEDGLNEIAGLPQGDHRGKIIGRQQPRGLRRRSPKRACGRT